MTNNGLIQAAEIIARAIENAGSDVGLGLFIASFIIGMMIWLKG